MFFCQFSVILQYVCQFSVTFVYFALLLRYLCQFGITFANLALLLRDFCQFSVTLALVSQEFSKVSQEFSRVFDNFVKWEALGRNLAKSEASGQEFSQVGDLVLEFSLRRSPELQHRRSGIQELAFSIGDLEDLGFSSEDRESKIEELGLRLRSGLENSRFGL